MAEIRQVIRLCLLSRIVISTLAIVSDLLLPDHNADAYRNDLFSDDKESLLDSIILKLTKGFIRWDAQYFLVIAHENGYPEEKMLAFFPLFPFVIRNVGIVLQSLASLLFIKMSLLSAIVISAYLVNLIAFIAAGVFLYELTTFMFQSKSIASHVMTLFAFNPASIFFTAFYTESVYCCLTFGALYFLYKHESPFIATILFALSAYTRSNGLVSFGYIAFYQAVKFTPRFKSSNSHLVTTTKFILSTGGYLLICLLPWGLYNLSAWKQFCQVQSLPASRPVWCDSVLPFPYSHVQSTYWEVGFLRYYQWRKIPNFLMAAPTLALVLWSGIWFFKQNHSQLKTLYVSSLFFSKSQMLLEPTHLNQMQNAKKTIIFKQICLVPFIIHSLFLALFCLLLMHVEVATRFLFSSSPWPYWALFHITKESLLGPNTKYIVPAWQFGYVVIGTIMFANFLPFT